MVLFASSLHFFSEACLLDPWATEAAFCKIPFFNAFRSKEIWLDAFQHISNDPTFMLSAAEKQHRADKSLASQVAALHGSQRTLQEMQCQTISVCQFSSADQQAESSHRRIHPQSFQRFLTQFGVHSHSDEVEYAGHRGISRRDLPVLS